MCLQCSYKGVRPSEDSQDSTEMSTILMSMNYLFHHSKLHHFNLLLLKIFTEMRMNYSIVTTILEVL